MPNAPTLTISQTPSLKPGDLRHYVYIQTETSGTDWDEASTSCYTTLFTGRAAIEQQGAYSPKEVVAGNATASMTTHLVRMYYRPDYAVIAGMFVNCPGQKLLLRIETVYNVLSRNRVLHLFCTEVDPYLPVDTSSFALSINGVAFAVAPAQLWLNDAMATSLLANTVNGSAVN